MRKLATSLGRIVFVLLLLAGLSVCKMAAPTESAPPEDALSFDQLVANLDALAGAATQSPSMPGRSVFGLPGGSLLSSADLSAYLNAIKKDLAAYVYSCTGGAPYLVVASKVPLSATGSTSGLVWVPFTWGLPKQFPIISYQHGTQVYRECAPSRFNANPLAVLVSPDLTGAFQNYVECIVGGLMASAGYIVVMPDYQGFGDSTATHPYVHLSLGDSVRDIVAWAQSYFTRPRAARANGKVYLTGYSEGGYTTMAGAGALWRAGRTVTGVVPCDGAYSLSGTMLEVMLDDKVDLMPSYLLYTAAGYNAFYGTPGDPAAFLRTFLETDPIDYVGLMVTKHPFDGNHTNQYVSDLGLPPYAGDMIQGWTLATLDRPATLEPGGDVWRLLDNNNAWQGWVPSCPIAFVHCPDDDIVPYANAEAAQVYYAMHGLAVPIFDVPYVPFVETALGTKHVAAYPTAMLRAFQLIYLGH